MPQVLVPQTMPISQLGKNPNIVRPMLDNGPVLMMSRTNPIGMLIKPEEWNAFQLEMGRLRKMHAEELRKRSDRVKAGEYVTLAQVDHDLGS